MGCKAESKKTEGGIRDNRNVIDDMWDKKLRREEDLLILTGVKRNSF